MLGVNEVHRVVLLDTKLSDDIESVEGVPLFAWASCSRTSSLSISTFRPRRRASAPELFLLEDCNCADVRLTLTSSVEHDEETGELARVLADEVWLDVAVDRKEKLGDAWFVRVFGVVANMMIV